MSSTRTLIIAGPTAGGKSSLAMDMASILPRGAEIVSADSMQAYRGMDIGTAKPTVDEQSRVRHHGIDIADPHREEPTVADWLAGAHTAIADIHARGKCALVVGGTNLYLRAFIDGLAPTPPSDESLRATLEARGLASLREELERVDPVAAGRIHPNDLRRTVRALEVAHLTGRPISEHHTQWGSTLGALPVGCGLIGIDWEPEAINRRINSRVRTMMTSGFLAEVEHLRAVGPLLRQPSEAVGYGEMLAHLDGTLTIEEAEQRTAIRTRQYAKQQRTWLKRFRAIPGTLWVRGCHLDSPTAVREIIDNFRL